MFAIGDQEWPGLSKLTEECGEVLQVIGKLIASGGLVEHWDGSNLKERLETELGDLKAAIAFVIKHCNLDGTAIVRREVEKLRRFSIWHSSGDANQKALK
jgi:NTP pyrophosphatase (non-canonical NTP hydrolase)